MRPFFQRLMASILIVNAAPAALSAGQFGIDTESEYLAFIDAVRASEYVRQDLVESDGAPRVIAVVAGVVAFVETNPLATTAQVEGFIDSYNAALTSFSAADPALLRGGTLVSALRSTWVPSSGVLTGMDTRVGEAIIAILGPPLPELDGFIASQERLGRFDQATVRRLSNRSSTAQILVRGLYGDVGTGEPREDLSAVVATYLESQGFAPMLGMVNPAQAEVNAGLAGLPTYAEFQAITSDRTAAAALEAEVFASVDAIQLEAMNMIDSIAAQDTPDDLMQSTAALYAAAADPGAPGHAAAVALLVSQQDAILARIQSTSDERAEIFAKTFILAQSQFEDVQFAAFQTQDFTGLQLETSSTLAVAEQSVGVAGSVVGIAAGFASGDLWGGVQSTVDLIAGALGLADILGGGPSAEEQIFDQIVELRMQVQELGVQLNSRFDAVDQKLNIIFGTVVDGFSAIGEDIGDLQDDVDALTIDIFKARTQLQRLEDALFGFAEDVLLQDLIVQMNLVLDYRNDTGADLPYADGNPNFVVAANDFFSFATATSKNNTFAGPSSPTLGLFNANEVIGDGVIGRVINEVRFVPPGLVTSGGISVAGPLIAARAPGPAPWAQAAAAYAQLARESPWYFAYMFENQLLSMPGDTELDQITEAGRTLTQLSNAARDPDLFDALGVNGMDSAAGVQAALNGVVFHEMAALGLANANGAVDPWGSISQPGIFDVAPTLTQVAGPDGPLGVPAGTSFNGWGVTAGGWIDAAYPVTGQADLVQQVTLGALVDPGGPLSDIVVGVSIIPDQASGCGSGFVQIRIATLAGPFPDYKWVVIREVFGIIEVFANGQWVVGAVCSPFLDLDAALVNAWPQLSTDLAQNDVSFNLYDAGLIQCGVLQSCPARITISFDQTFAGTSGFDAPTALPDFITANLDRLRNDEARPGIASALVNPATPLAFAAENLDNAEALLDGYATIALGPALDRSEVLRSGLRAGAGVSDIGLRADDLGAILQQAASRDIGAIGGAPGLDVPDIGIELAARFDAVVQEALAGLELSEAPFPYIEFVLADLDALGANAFRLAIDDLYETTGTLTVGAAEGLIANDVTQPGLVAQTLGVDLDFFASPDWTPPTHGRVAIDADGSFTYTSDPGFEGEDSFTYRLSAEVDASLGDPLVVSDPATVVIRIPTQSPCLGDTNGNGIIDTTDLGVLLGAFGGTAPPGTGADLNSDGIVDTTDLGILLGAFGTVCP